MGCNTLTASKKKKKKKKKKKRRGRLFWIQALFADRTTSGASQSLILKMKEIVERFFLGLFVCHRIDLTIYLNLKSL